MVVEDLHETPVYKMNRKYCSVFVAWNVFKLMGLISEMIIHGRLLRSRHQERDENGHMKTLAIYGRYFNFGYRTIGRLMNIFSLSPIFASNSLTYWSR